MTSKRSILLTMLCGLAVAGAGCGDDNKDSNKALSYGETGTEIGKICDSVDLKGLNGDPANDVPILKKGIPSFEKAVEDVRKLDVAEELKADRDAFADNADQQIVIIKEAQTAAEKGDKKAYQATVKRAQPLDKESDLIAARLGASACINP
jgi:hypothetical protein